LRPWLKLNFLIVFSLIFFARALITRVDFGERRRRPWSRSRSGFAAPLALEEPELPISLKALTSRAGVSAWAVRPHRIPSPFFAAVLQPPPPFVLGSLVPRRWPQRKSCVDFVRRSLANRANPAAQRIDLHNLALFFRARNSVVLSNSALIALSSRAQDPRCIFGTFHDVASYARFA
jgi:hypothetical protein